MAVGRTTMRFWSSMIAQDQAKRPFATLTWPLMQARSRPRPGEQTLDSGLARRLVEGVRPFQFCSLRRTPGKFSPRSRVARVQRLRTVAMDFWDSPQWRLGI